MTQKQLRIYCTVEQRRKPPPTVPGSGSSRFQRLQGAVEVGQGRDADIVVAVAVGRGGIAIPAEMRSLADAALMDAADGAHAAGLHDLAELLGQGQKDFAAERVGAGVGLGMPPGGRLVLPGPLRLARRAPPRLGCLVPLRGGRGLLLGELLLGGPQLLRRFHDRALQLLAEIANNEALLILSDGGSD
jgi:hypothetical protein